MGSQKLRTTASLQGLGRPVKLGPVQVVRPGLARPEMRPGRRRGRGAPVGRARPLAPPAWLEALACSHATGWQCHAINGYVGQAAGLLAKRYARRKARKLNVPQNQQQGLAYAGTEPYGFLSLSLSVVMELSSRAPVDDGTESPLAAPRCRRRIAIQVTFAAFSGQVQLEGPVRNGLLRRPHSCFQAVQANAEPFTLLEPALKVNTFAPLVVGQFEVAAALVAAQMTEQIRPGRPQGPPLLQTDSRPLP